MLMDKESDHSNNSDHNGGIVTVADTIVDGVDDKESNHSENSDHNGGDTKNKDMPSQNNHSHKIPDTLKLFSDSISTPAEKNYFHKISHRRMGNLIDSMKASRTTGPDELDMNTIKQLKEITIPVLTNLFNSVVETESYPKNKKQVKYWLSSNQEMIPLILTATEV